MSSGLKTWWTRSSADGLEMAAFKRACSEIKEGICYVAGIRPQGEKKHERKPHTSKLKQYLSFWKMSTNSSSGGGRALAVSKSSVVMKQ